VTQPVIQTPRSHVRRYVIALLAIVAVSLLLWPGAIRSLFQSGPFMPHGTCYMWNQPLIWLHFSTDLLIAISYLAISLMLTFLVHRARRDIPFSWIFLAFGLFIVACGATHFMEVVVLWNPLYWASGMVKLVTAVASVATAIVLPPLIPRTLAMIQDAKLSRQRKMELEERLAALEQEKMARAEAEEASRAKDTFLATISHELRTPMTSIIGWSSVLARGDLDAATMQTAIDAIEKSARLQAQLIEDLLDVSRIVAGKMKLDLAPVDLSNVIRNSLEGASHVARGKDVKIECILPPAPPVVFGDERRLQQIVGNLVSNAIKFTPSGERITVELRTVDSAAQIDVIDGGQGVPEVFVPHLFDRFSQADSSTSRSHGGLGLGLAIVRHLVELHGGQVEVEPRVEGRGARFSVLLHLLADQEQPHPAAEAEDANLSGIRILLVEDEPLTREMLSVALRQRGAIVTETGSVREAMKGLDPSEIDLVLTDIAMPGEDGFSLLRRIRALPDGSGARLPVVALSALVRAGEQDRIRDAGFDESLQKPIRAEALAVAIARVVGRL
jgi:signal transduction histidine kinase/ActR/RegA family two-component response regulator